MPDYHEERFVNGRCDNDPLDQAEDVCDGCGGDFCGACLLYPRGKKRPPVCKACAIARAGLRSSSKSVSTTGKKQVRKRRKELAAATENAPQDGFVFFDEPGSDVILRDASILNPVVEDEPKSKRKKRKKKSKDALPEPRGNGTADLQPAEDPPEVETWAEEDAATDATVAAASSTRRGSIPVEEFLEEAGREDEAPDQPPPPASADDESSSDDPPPPVADDASPLNDKPSATELLSRLKEAQRVAPLAGDAGASADPADPWIPAAANSTTTDAGPQQSADVDITVNPFGDPTPAPAARERMEAWQPPEVTPQTATSDQREPEMFVAPETLPATPLEEPSAVDGPHPAETGLSFAHEPDFAPDVYEDVAFDHNPQFQGTDTDVQHETSFENTSFENTSFENTPASKLLEASEPDPIDVPAQPVEVPEALRPKADLAIAGAQVGGASGLGESPASETKADTDDGGNWIPPALRGMAPKEVRDAEVLPKRRSVD